MKIQKPLLTQLPEIIKLWEKQYEYHHALDNDYYVKNTRDLKEEFREYLAKAITKNNPNILVASEGNKLIAFVTFEKAKADYFDTNIKDYGEVIELFVDDTYRNKGVGRQLMKAVEDYFSNLGITWIEIQASTYNRPALSFYKQLGYANRQSLLFKKILPRTVSQETEDTVAESLKDIKKGKVHTFKSKEKFLKQLQESDDA